MKFNREISRLLKGKFKKIEENLQNREKDISKKCQENQAAQTLENERKNQDVDVIQAENIKDRIDIEEEYCKKDEETFLFRMW